METPTITMEPKTCSIQTWPTVSTGVYFSKSDIILYSSFSFFLLLFFKKKIVPFYCPDGPLPVPGAGPPMSCWNSPPGETVPSQFGTHSPPSHLNGSSFPEPPIQ